MPTIEELQDQLAAANARVTTVSEEAKGYRLNMGEAKKAQEAAEKARETAEGALAKAKEEHAAELGRVRTEEGEKLTKAEQRAVASNLRLAAKEAGANDPADVQAFIPADKLKVGEDGEITNAAELMADLKKAKPYLFGTGSTSSTAKEPKQEPPNAKKATEMTDEEYAAERAKLRRQ